MLPSPRILKWTPSDCSLNDKLRVLDLTEAKPPPFVLVAPEKVIMPCPTLNRPLDLPPITLSLTERQRRFGVWSSNAVKVWVVSAELGIWMRRTTNSRAKFIAVVRGSAKFGLVIDCTDLTSSTIVTSC